MKILRYRAPGLPCVLEYLQIHRKLDWTWRSRSRIVCSFSLVSGSSRSHHGMDPIARFSAESVLPETRLNERTNERTIRERLLVANWITRTGSRKLIIESTTTVVLKSSSIWSSNQHCHLVVITYNIYTEHTYHYILLSLRLKVK